MCSPGTVGLLTDSKASPVALHLTQRAFGRKTPLQAIRTWQTKRAELFTARRNNRAELDS